MRFTVNCSILHCWTALHCTVVDTWVQKKTTFIIVLYQMWIPRGVPARGSGDQGFFFSRWWLFWKWEPAGEAGPNSAKTSLVSRVQALCTLQHAYTFSISHNYYWLPCFLPPATACRFHSGDILHIDDHLSATNNDVRYATNISQHVTDSLLNS